MIYTITLNPSIDYIVRVDHLTMGAVNRTSSDFKLPGGKGINVSRILKRIDASATALGFLGGFTGEFIENWLTHEEVPHRFTKIAADTRINLKMKSDVETEVNGLGPNLSDEEITSFKEQLRTLQASDIVVLAGSTPASLRKGFYQELITLIKEKDADFVIDTTGKDLLDALPSQPLLVKPNNHELAEMYQTTFNGLDDLIFYGKKLIEDGAKHAIISMAGDGALLFTKDHVYQSNVLKRPLKNSVGAGDSMIAGFVGCYAATKDPVEAFKMGVACGSATAFSDDLATSEFIQELLPEVVITKL